MWSGFACLSTRTTASTGNRAGDDLRQGDLLFNVPIALMPERPRFVFGDGETRDAGVRRLSRERALDQIIVAARFGVLGMVVTPTCHVSEGEKDEDIVAVVPVEALNLVVGHQRGSEHPGR